MPSTNSSTDSASPVIIAPILTVKVGPREHWHHYLADNPMGNMAPVAPVKILQLDEYCRRDLEWGLRPILFLLRIFGIDLDMNRPRSDRCRRFGFLALGISILIVSSFYGFKLINTLSYFVSQASSEVSYLILIIIPTIIFNPAYYGTTLVTTQLKWQRLWQKIQKLEHVCPMTDNFYSRLRKTLIASIIVFSLQVHVLQLIPKFRSVFISIATLKEAGVAGLMFGTFDQAEATMQLLIKEVDKIGLGIQISIQIYKNFFVLLYLSLIWLASESIQVLTDEIQTWPVRIKRPLNYRVRNWKYTYLEISSLIKEINGFFGPSMILIFSSIFTQIILSSYKVVVISFRDTDDNVAVYLLRLVFNTLIVLILISATEAMRSKVFVCTISENQSANSVIDRSHRHRI